jgi:hypothetical protein
MLDADFKSEYFDDVAAALQEKYGPATSKEAPMITTRAGLRAPDTQLFWRLGRDTIVAQRCAGTIAEGTVTYRDSSVEGEMRARSREQVKAGQEPLARDFRRRSKNATPQGEHMGRKGADGSWRHPFAYRGYRRVSFYRARLAHGNSN